MSFAFGVKEGQKTVDQDKSGQISSSSGSETRYHRSVCTANRFSPLADQEDTDFRRLDILL